MKQTWKTKAEPTYKRVITIINTHGDDNDFLIRILKTVTSRLEYNLQNNL